MGDFKAMTGETKYTDIMEKYGYKMNGVNDLWKGAIYTTK